MACDLPSRIRYSCHEHVRIYEYIYTCTCMIGVRIGVCIVAYWADSTCMLVLWRGGGDRTILDVGSQSISYVSCITQGIISRYRRLLTKNEIEARRG